MSGYLVCVVISLVSGLAAGYAMGRTDREDADR